MLSPTLEVMRPSIAPCSVSNSCSRCRRPWWNRLQARTETRESRARTTTGPSMKRTKVSTRYRTGSPSGADEGRYEMIIFYKPHPCGTRNVITTCGESCHQWACGGVAVAHLLGAAENGVVEGGRRGAQHTDLLRVHQTAALKLHPTVPEFYGRKAPCPVALGGLVAFITQAGQLSICPSKRHGINIQKVYHFSEMISLIVCSFNCTLLLSSECSPRRNNEAWREVDRVPEPSADVCRPCSRSSRRTCTRQWSMSQCAPAGEQQETDINTAARRRINIYQL